jgi:hypothetical protein
MVSQLRLVKAKLAHDRAQGRHFGLESMQTHCWRTPTGRSREVHQRGRRIRRGLRDQSDLSSEGRDFATSIEAEVSML